ncbi:MAG: Gldg family protein [Planctomycetota bacterium]
MNKLGLSLTGCALALVLFLALNIVSNSTLRSVRLDVTEDKVYTLDENSTEIAAKLDEPIHLYFYFSRSLARDYPQVIQYADRILGILKEYERASAGNIQLAIVDPEPFSEQEDEAVQRGIQGVPLPSGDQLYFGLVGTNATDARESIPFFALEDTKQRTLEYDLSKLVWTLAHPDKKKVGILSAMPLEGGGGNPMLGQEGTPPWAFIEQVGDFFEVEVLPSAAESIAEDVDILAVIHPRSFSDATLYLIDQWALAGKPLVIFVDPLCEADPGESADPSNPLARFTSKRDSNLERLFQAWGFEMAKDKIAGDRTLAQRRGVRSGSDGRGVIEIPIVFYLSLGPDDVSKDDPVTRQLNRINLTTPGSLKKLADGTTTFTPILQTSEESQEIDATNFQFVEPQTLLANFVPGYQRLTLAARVAGNVKTAFPEGKPKGPENAEESPETPAEGPVAGLIESQQPLNLLVFADADILGDRAWMQSLGNFGGQQMMAVTADNVDLFKNAVESAAGGEELMGIRLRGKTTRPFEKVQEIQRNADEKFLKRQQELESRLKDIDRRRLELQKAKGEGSEELVTAAQREQEEQINEEFVQTRRDLRDVKHQLRKDIDGLGWRLMLINTLLVPFLLILFALVKWLMRLLQRSAKTT